MLERLLALVALRGEVQLRIHLIDPIAGGTGVHGTDNAEYVLLNTTTNLPTMFPGKVGDDPRTWREGPSFYEWCTDHYGSVERYGCLPRRLFGEYLKFSYHEILAARPHHVTIVSHERCAVDITDNSRAGCDIMLSDGTTVRADATVLATGHSLSANDDGAISSGDVITVPYPTHEKLAKVTEDSSIAISGLGLSFYDVVAELTVGRGGRWSKDRSGQLRYVASGREPRIAAFSRSGLPFRSRPRADGRRPHVPAHLSRRISSLKLSEHPLAFSRDVEPLIYEGMKAEYYRVKSGCDMDAIGDNALPPRGDTAMASWLQNMEQRFGELDAHRLLWPLPYITERREAYRSWFASFIAEDLEAARCGVDDSPEKAAIEVLFNGRGLISDVVSFGGITSESRRDFYERFVPAMNRNVVGPQLERNEELLVLIQTGILDPLGPSQAHKNPLGSGYVVKSTTTENTNITVDWLCYARAPEAGGGQSLLLRQLQHSGYVLANAVDGSVPGIVVDRDNSVLAAGSVKRPLWAIGPICEGSRYYNNYVPLDNGYTVCPAFNEAHQLAMQILEKCIPNLV